MYILVINPGGGSTKVAVFHKTRQVLSDTVEHPPNQLVRFGHVLDQYRLRRSSVLAVLERHGFDVARTQAIAARGGPLLPLPGGVYRVTPRVVADIRRGQYQTLHPALLGPLIAHELGQELSIPAYFVDPESTDEFCDEARVSGFHGISRVALSHALSCRTVCRAAAHRLKKPYEQSRFVVAHLGTGITVAAHVRGRQIDASNANDDGPFSPQRTGTLPLSAVVRTCYSGRYTEAQVLALFQTSGGLLSYLDTDDIRRVEAMIDAGNKTAGLVYRALVYQVAKEIGAYCAVCGRTPDAVVLTGGLTLSKNLVRDLKKQVGFLCPKILVFPGEEEMSAMADRLRGVLSGEEKERSYEHEVALRR
ncbi:butyrate kinase [candidate division WOR-3 bacterium]|nr:butyrate kinase [candidate division WOR-3 bacterium]